MIGQKCLHSCHTITVLGTDCVRVVTKLVLMNMSDRYDSGEVYTYSVGQI